MAALAQATQLELAINGVSKLTDEVAELRASMQTGTQGTHQLVESKVQDLSSVVSELRQASNAAEEFQAQEARRHDARKMRKMRHMMFHLQNRSSSAVFGSWKELWGDARRARVVCARVSTRRRARQMGCAWGAWAAAARAAARQREVRSALCFESRRAILGAPRLPTSFQLWTVLSVAAPVRWFR